MDFVNETGVEAGWNIGFQPDGREVVVVVVKATYDLPATSTPNAPTPLAALQRPLTEADEFGGEPGESAPTFETDYSVHKPYCDVLFVGRAYGPHGRPVHKTAVRIAVGALTKTIAVHGNRHWRRTAMGLRPSEPQLFDAIPISYDNAFGGIDRTKEADGKTATFMENPVGRGYFESSKAALGQPLCNTEELRNPVVSPNGKYRPMALGPIGRSWFPRYRFAGTYDKRWMDERSPILPTDFDNRYFQAAPADQQISYPTGGEQVVLQNLSKEGILSFALPREKRPVLFIPYKGEDTHRQAVMDTIVFVPDERCFCVTWRATLPLVQDCFEIKQTIVGTMSRSWHSKRRAERLGKTYYPSLRELVKNKGAR